MTLVLCWPIAIPEPNNMMSVSCTITIYFHSWWRCLVGGLPVWGIPLAGVGIALSHLLHCLQYVVETEINHIKSCVPKQQPTDWSLGSTALAVNVASRVGPVMRCFMLKKKKTSKNSMLKDHVHLLSGLEAEVLGKNSAPSYCQGLNQKY